ncbi:hypothetical protein Ciccas_005629 [Cichlidogyrus casuarinus]|uniref:Uncharacterized protein n=1 Tax=Cichlidogyrus casuarinus TaxID=1844966 RepID=A0ABD2Q8C5_9PLAT
MNRPMPPPMPSPMQMGIPPVPLMQIQHSNFYLPQSGQFVQQPGYFQQHHSLPQQSLPQPMMPSPVPPYSYQDFEKNLFKAIEDSAKFRVLVVDELATTILASCFKMHQITDMGITLVENLFKKRQPLPLEAVYLIEPTRESIELLKGDYSGNRPRYSCAHIFFLHECSEIFIREIGNSPVANFVHTLTELEYAFLPIESHIFSLDSRETGSRYPQSQAPDTQSRQTFDLEIIANRLVTLCQTLNECPRLCFQNGMKINSQLATLVQQKLSHRRGLDPQLGQGPHKDKSILLIVDRSIDLVSPLLHELTFQAMVYDIVENIEDDLYTIGHGSTLDLLDRDPIWAQYRHEHVANRIDEFQSKKKKKPDLKKDPDDDHTKQIKNYRKLIDEAWIRERRMEEDTLVGMTKLIDQCIKHFSDVAEIECRLEQDLVMGQDDNNQPLLVDQGRLATLCSNGIFSPEDKIRVILLNMFIRDETDESYIDRMFKCGNLDSSYYKLVVGFCKWFGAQLMLPNIDVLSPMSEQTKVLKLMPSVRELLSKYPFKKWCLPQKGHRSERWEPEYVVSRWNPYLLDLMESCISGKLDPKAFNLLPSCFSGQGDRLEIEKDGAVGISLRFKGGGEAGGKSTARNTYQGNRGNSLNNHVGPRLIICVLGGFTFSETRSAYKITKHCVEARLAASDTGFDRGANHDGRSGLLSKMGRPNPDLTAGKSNLENVLSSGGGLGWNWEVFLGGTHVLTPKTFLQDLKDLGDPFSQENGHSQGYTNLALE